MAKAIGPVFFSTGVIMGKKDVAEFVCAPFCSFYREGLKEDLLCNGARLVEMLMAKGILSPGRLSGIKREAAISTRKDRIMENVVCAPCPFLEDGCDFRAKAPPPGAVPCGGYILLDLLVAKGIIAMDVLKESGNG